MNSNAKNLVDTPISPECFASIVIPVRDEAEHIEKTLESLSNQVDLQNEPLDSNLFEIIVLANNCSDDSARLARNWKNRNEKITIHIAELNLPPENSNIGFVRRLLMNEAHRRLRHNKFRKGIIMTTDGDTRVAPDWIAQNIKEVVNGADAVGGRILLENSELEKMNETARYFHLLDEEYRLLAAEYECFLDTIPHDAFPRHHQHFNGSFAVTTIAFQRAGGIPEVEFLEDVAFYHALLRVDAKVRHSPHVKVYTSARNVGRSEVGLSFQINQWTVMGENGDAYLVEPADTIEKRIETQKLLRFLWARIKAEDFLSANEVSRLAQDMEIPVEQLFDESYKNQFCGGFLETVFRIQNETGTRREKFSLVPIEQAVSDLRKRLDNLRLKTAAGG